MEPSAEAGGEAPVILVTTVDIGEGKAGRIELRQGDDPSDAAARFCQQYGLPDTIITPLANHIVDHLHSQHSQPPEQEAHDASNAPADTPPGPHGRGSSGKKKRRSGPQKVGPGPPRCASPTPRMRAALEEVQSMSLAEKEKSKKKHTPGRVGSGRATVHDRLYANAVDKLHRAEERQRIYEVEQQISVNSTALGMAPVSRNMTKSRGAGDYHNYGERLYVEGLMEAEKKAQRAEQREQEKVAQEEAGATFKPEISKMARAITSARSADAPAWQRLYRGQGSKTRDRLDSIRATLEENEAKECTFRPEIDRKSSRLMSERTEVLREHRISAHDQLFQDAVRRRLRQEEYANWYPEDVTFRPQTALSAASYSTVRSSLQAIKRGGRPAAEVPGPIGSHSEGEQFMKGNLVDRLYASYHKREEKVAEARRQRDAPVDSATGQKLYQPKVGRGPSYQRNSSRLPIGDYLYGIRYETADKKEYLSELANLQTQQDANTKFTTNKSSAISDKLRNRRFRQIFEYLDELAIGRLPLLGLVAENAGKMDTLDPEVHADVVAAAQLHESRVAAAREADEERAPSPNDADGFVDLPTFTDLMRLVTSKASGVPRTYLQPTYHSTSYEDWNHQPQLCEKSRMLAGERVHNVCDRLYRHAQETEADRQRKRKEKEVKELKECTFRPELVSDQLVSHGKALRLSQALVQSVHSPEAFEPGNAFSAPPGQGGTPHTETVTAITKEYDELEQQVQQVLVATALSSAAAQATLDELASAPGFPGISDSEAAPTSTADAAGDATLAELAGAPLPHWDGVGGASDLALSHSIATE